MAYLRLGERSIVARLRPRDLASAGGTVRLAIDMNRASLFDPDSGKRID